MDWLNNAWQGFSGAGGMGRDPSFWAGLGGSLGGLAGAIGGYGSQNAAAERQKRLINQLKLTSQGYGQQQQAFANAPLDVNQYLNPVKGPAEEAYMRQLKANMATSGIPFDGSYASNMMAEGLAGQEANWYKQAQDTAASERAKQLAAMTGSQNQTLQQMAMGLNQPGKPNFLQSIFGSNMGGLGQYFNNRQQQQNQQQAQQGQMEQWRKMIEAMRGGGGQTPGAAVTSNLPGLGEGQNPNTFTGGTAPDASLGNTGGTSTTGQPFTGNLNPYGGDYSSDYASAAY